MSALRAEARESRPTATNGEPAQSISTAIKTMTSVPMAADLLADLDSLAESLRGYLVVQVEIDDAGHRRTHLFRSAGAAQKAVERARARGRRANVSVCQLLPVGVVHGLEVA